MKKVVSEPWLGGKILHELGKNGTEVTKVKCLENKCKSTNIIISLSIQPPTRIHTKEYKPLIFTFEYLNHNSTHYRSPGEMEL